MGFDQNLHSDALKIGNTLVAAPGDQCEPHLAPAGSGLVKASLSKSSGTQDWPAASTQISQNCEKAEI